MWAVPPLVFSIWFSFCPKKWNIGLVFERIRVPTTDGIKIFSLIVPSFLSGLIVSFIGVTYRGLVSLSTKSATAYPIQVQGHVCSLSKGLTACSQEAFMESDQPHGLSTHS